MGKHRSFLRPEDHATWLAWALSLLGPDDDVVEPSGLVAGEWIRLEGGELITGGI